MIKIGNMEFEKFISEEQIHLRNKEIIQELKKN